jgi:hypothetical protein
MHSGILMVIRRFMLHAKLWQQVLVCVCLVAVGVALVIAGLFVGAVMVFCGVLFGWQSLSVHRTTRSPRLNGDIAQSATAPSIVRTASGAVTQRSAPVNHVSDPTADRWN